MRVTRKKMKKLLLELDNLRQEVQNAHEERDELRKENKRLHQRLEEARHETQEALDALNSHREEYSEVNRKTCFNARRREKWSKKEMNSADSKNS